MYTNTRIIFGIYLILLSVSMILDTVNAQVKSPKGKVEITVKKTDILIDYSRPYKKGREIFGGLVPYNKYWRTGANLATEISFSKDVIFGNKPIEAGRYRLYSIPGEDKWIFRLNSELNKKGFYEPDHDLDVLEITAFPESMDQEFEQFTIELIKIKNGANAIFKWDKTKVTVPIKLK